MKDIISRYLVPPYGWHYTEGECLITAPTYAALVSILTERRKSNKQDAGDPDLDIQTQIANKYPQLKLLK